MEFVEEFLELWFRMTFLELLLRMKVKTWQSRVVAWWYW